MRLPLVLTVVTSASAVFGLVTDDVLFYALFDGSPDATLARGCGEATPEASVEFVVGLWPCGSQRQVFLLATANRLGRILGRA
jgi:hypothetical protein